jgi:3'-phosphoadenosine 5'-phosphosulfate sulfotransferase (PAPS reductase)/FAD synthetase
MQQSLFPTRTVDPVAYGKRLLDIAVRRHKPVAICGMFSGGHDSLCAVHMASQLPGFTGAVHINTGIGIEQTREFVRQTCRDQCWPLLEIRAKEDMGQDYDALVLDHGFPGPFHHRKMYNRLKERALYYLVRQYKRERRDRVLLVTGVRREESTRRMGTVQPINRNGAMVWVAPLTHFTGLDKNGYIERHQLPRNEVVDLLHMSGECLCGAFAKPGELDEIAAWFPEEAARIRNLEEQAKEAGVHCRWGERPPKADDPDQGDMFQPLCVGCEHKHHGGDV